ncbi:MAG: fimbrillin family protein [Muribaculaceae bacterium]|nr:fimbrillin family protein [Muribaculaceae bacterium]MDE6559147.1 fimbrillin family protein [Muribaculaceae bacterium]
MKKILLSLITCGLTLASCTSEDVVNEGPQSNAITFRNVVNKNTRSIDTGSFSQFFVYGYYTKGLDLNTRFNIFTNTPVIKSTDGWSSAISRYWVDGANYSFYAFSCENVSMSPKYGGPSIDQNDGTFRINYTCHTDELGNSHDLVFASATGIQGQRENNLPVPLQFKHILSQVSLQFVSDFPEGYQVEISNISISDFENMGTFTANKTGNSEGTWSGVRYDDTNAKSFTLNALNGHNITASDKDAQGNMLYPPVETSSCFMIPNTYDAAGGDNPVNIHFNIRLINPNLGAANQTIASNTLIGSWHPKWRQGTKYVYTIHLSGNEAGMDQIKFDVGVTDWNNPDTDNTPEKINISFDYVLTPNAE